MEDAEEAHRSKARCHRMFSLADAIQRRVGPARSRAGKLPQAILANAFSGELVPTEAELARVEGRIYETAEELLARVRHESDGGMSTSASKNNGAAQCGRIPIVRARRK